MNVKQVVQGLSLALLGATLGMQWATSQFVALPVGADPSAAESVFHEGDFVRDRLTGEEGIVERVWYDGTFCFRTGRAGGFTFSPAGFERIDALTEPLPQ